MRALLLLPVLLLGGYSHQDSTASNAEPLVEVLSFKWAKSRQASPQVEPNAPGTPSIQSRIYESQRKEPIPAGHRPQDPNLDALETRHGKLDRIGQESPAIKPVDGFDYRVKMRNANSRVITGLVWEYQFKELLNPTSVTSRQFYCRAKIKPNKHMDFRIFSTLGPSNVISVASLSNKDGSLFEETVIINFVEFSDGSFWQRKDWNSEEASRAHDALKTRFSGQCLAR